jgi:hypothetical protein
VKTRYIVEGQAGPRWVFLASAMTILEAAQRIAMYLEHYPKGEFRVHEETRRDIPESALQEALNKEDQ